MSFLLLIETVDELIVLLEDDAETHWADWMRKVSVELKASDYHGVERLLKAYGGMGSCNDFVPRKAENDHRINQLAT